MTATTYRSPGLLIALAAAALLLTPTAGRADKEELSRARALIKNNASTIMFFGLPTYKYKDVAENDARTLKNGLELTYTFQVDSRLKTSYVKMSFLFNLKGDFESSSVVTHNTYYTPFTDALGDKELKKVRQFVTEHPKVKDDVDMLKLANRYKAQELLEMYLKLEQR